MSKTCAYRVQVQTDSGDRNGVALFSNKQLVGILIELSDACHGADRGRWVIETMFGTIKEPVKQNFATAAAAADWVTDNISHDRFMLGKAG